MTTSAAEGLGPGRPRDPDVDHRVVVAAVGLFGEAGWAGFSIEAVARRAGVFHAMTAQPGTHGKVRSMAGTYAERLVDFLLTAVTAR